MITISMADRFSFLIFIPPEVRALIRKLFVRDGILFAGHLARLRRETRSTGSAASFVSTNRRNVQLDQFSNISGTGQCPGCARADAGTRAGPPTKFTFWFKCLATKRIYRGHIGPRRFLSFLRRFFLSFHSRRRRHSLLHRATHGRFSPFVRIKTTQLPTSRHADGKVTTGSATDVH